MKDIKQLLDKGKVMFIRKDRLLIGLLSGILLLVIIWPVPEEKTPKESEESFLWDISLILLSSSHLSLTQSRKALSS